MVPAKVHVDGPGLRVETAVGHPAGTLLSGGYDAEKNEVFLASVMGHPRGVAAAGGTPSSNEISGLRLLIVASGEVYWATDSMSLPRGLSDDEVDAVQTGIEAHFAGHSVQRVQRLEDIPD